MASRSRPVNCCKIWSHALGSLAFCGFRSLLWGRLGGSCRFSTGRCPSALLRYVWSSNLVQSFLEGVQESRKCPSCVFGIPSLSVTCRNMYIYIIAVVYCRHCFQHQWFPVFQGLREGVCFFFWFVFVIEFFEAFVLWSVSKVVVIGCSGFRACQPNFLDPLERRLGKPVVTSTQAFLWHMDACLSRVGLKVSGYPVLDC